MPTPEEIKSIAREYARCTCIGTFDAQQRAEDEKVEYDFALPVLEWLCERYCLVEKSEVKERYDESKLRSKSGLKFDIITGNSRVSLLESLFGKSLFEEEK